MKLYKATYVHTSDAHDVDDWAREEEVPMPDPEGWAEHCRRVFGEYRPFFAPTDRYLYRSRSSAQGRVNLINRWFGDGAAVLEEADVEFVPVEQANARRARARRQARIDKLRAELAQLETLALVLETAERVGDQRVDLVGEQLGLQRHEPRLDVRDGLGHGAEDVGETRRGFDRVHHLCRCRDGHAVLDAVDVDRIRDAVNAGVIAGFTAHSATVPTQPGPGAETA